MTAMRSRPALGLVLALSVGNLAWGCKAKSPAESEGPASTAPVLAKTSAVPSEPPELAAVAAQQAQPQLVRGKLEIGLTGAAPVALTVEIASKDGERQKGLMFRKQLADDEGMIFLFATERYNSFWMHNTLIPLDMFFIDSEWNVVGVVENAQPLTDDPRRVPKMSRYVLEVKAGFAQRHGLGAGAHVKFMPPEALELP
jgi:uncharacterized membrane protein (UPF0127 family)